MATKDPYAEFAAPAEADPYAGFAAPAPKNSSLVDTAKRGADAAVGYAKNYGSKVNDAAGAYNRAPTNTPLSIADTALGVGSSIASVPAGLLDTLIGSVVPDPKNPTNSYSVARDKYQYQPHTEAGKANLGLAGAALEPVGDLISSTVGRGAGAVAEKFGASPENVQQTEDIATDVGSLALPVAARKLAKAAKGDRFIKAETKAPKAAEQPTPSKEELKDLADQAYKAADAQGIKVPESTFSSLKTDLTKNLDDAGYDKDLHPITTTALNRIQTQSGPVTLRDLETFRKLAKRAVAKGEPDDQRLGYAVVEHLHDFVENLKPGELEKGSGDAQLASQALDQARDYWSRARKADTVDELERKASLSPGSKSTALESQFRTLAKNPKKFRTFNTEEQAAIKDVVQPGVVRSGLQQVGKLAHPAGLGLGFALSNPALFAMNAAGQGANFLAGKLTSRAVGRVNELVRRGKPAAEAAPAAEVPEPSAVPAAVRTGGLSRIEGNPHALELEQALPQYPGSVEFSASHPPVSSDLELAENARFKAPAPEVNSNLQLQDVLQLIGEHAPQPRGPFPYTQGEPFSPVPPLPGGPPGATGRSVGLSDQLSLTPESTAEGLPFDPSGATLGELIAQALREKGFSNVRPKR